MVEPPHRDLRQGASLTLSLSHSRARADHLHCTRFTFALTSQENEGFLIQHFGEITAVIKEPGCYFVNVVEREMTWKSLKEQVIDTPAPGIKCLDCKSNPILVGGACYYRVEGVQAAVLAVENLELFIIKNFETVLKSVCSRYPYEADEDNPCSLKSESAQIGEELKRELQERTNFCGETPRWSPPLRSQPPLPPTDPLSPPILPPSSLATRLQG